MAYRKNNFVSSICKELSDAEDKLEISDFEILPRMLKTVPHLHKQYLEACPTIKARTVSIIAQIVGMASILIFGILIVNDGHFSFLPILLFASMVIGIYSFRIYRQSKIRRRRHLRWQFRQSEVANQPSNQDIISAIKEQADHAINTGNIVVNGHKNSIVIGSRVVEFIKSKKESDPKLTTSLTLVLGYLENTKNIQTAKVFEKLADEFKKETPDKVIVNVLWDSIVQTAPELKNMSTETAAITDYFINT